MKGWRPTLSQRLRRDPLAAAGAVVFGVLVLSPMLFSLAYAALYSVGLTGLLADGFTLRHWRGIAGGGDLGASFRWSIYLAATSTALTLGIALALALTLGRFVRSGWLGTLLHLPLALPATVAAFLIYVGLSPFGTLARVVRALGWIDPVEGLPSVVHHPLGLGIVLAHVVLAVPFFVLLFAQLYRQERLGEFADAARTLGARPGQVRWRVEIPVLLRRAAPSLLLLFVAVLGSYEIPLLLDLQAPQMLSVLAMRKFALFDITQKPEAFVVAVAYTVAVLAALGAMIRSGRMDP